MDAIIIIAGIIFFFFVCWVFFSSTSTKNNATSSESTIIEQDHPYTNQSLSPQEQYAREKMLAVLNYEFPNHERIIRESIALIEQTNNLFTLLGRYNDALEHCEWIIGKINEGYPITFHLGADDDYLANLNQFCNENILRIAIHVCRVAFDKSWEAKTQRGKQNRLASCFDDIERCKTELKEHPNKRYVSAALDDLYSQVEENISNILQDEPLKTFHCKEIQEYEPQSTYVRTEIGIAQSERDSLFKEAARFVVSSQQCSTSSIQRKFKLGYNRSSCILEQLEDAGIVGPLERNTREVRINDPIVLEKILDDTL